MPRSNQAQVVTGARSADSRAGGAEPVTDGASRLQELAAASSQAPVAKKLADIVYQASSPNYRLQLTPGKKKYDNFGNVEEVRPLVAQFENGFYTLDAPDDPNDVEAVKLFEYLRDKIEDGRYFGIGRDLWRVSDMADMAKKAQIDSLRAQLVANPELLKEALALVPSVESFKLPSPNADSSSADGAAVSSPAA